LDECAIVAAMMSPSPFRRPGESQTDAEERIARDLNATGRLVSRADLETVIEGLTQNYVDGRSDGSLHILTFTLSNGTLVRGHVVATEDSLIVGQVDHDNEQVSVPWDGVQKLLIEAD
jgi:hypothetical protein